MGRGGRGLGRLVMAVVVASVADCGEMSEVRLGGSAGGGEFELRSLRAPKVVAEEELDELFEEEKLVKGTPLRKERRGMGGGAVARCCC